MIRVIDWITYEEMIDFKEIYEEISKPFKMTSASRLDEIRPYGCEMLNIYFNEHYAEIEDALIKELVDNKYIICGDTHQELAIPVFEAGYVLLSMRRWKEIMEKAWCLLHNEEYPNFYMATVCSVKEVLPQCVSQN